MPDHHRLLRSVVEYRPADVGRAHDAAGRLDMRRSEVLRVLTERESWETALDEIERTLDTLRNVHREQVHLGAAHVDTIAVFLPINLPLYSLTLFAAIPSLMAQRVVVRAPAAWPDWVSAVMDVSGLAESFPGIELLRADRRIFVADVAAAADVIVFTGRHANAEQVRAHCPHGLFIYEGAGPNPIVVGPDADVARDIERLARPRLFNSGQDCAGPDAYLIHESMTGAFVAELHELLDGLPAGDYSDPNVRVGPALNRQPLASLAEWVNRQRGRVLRGGTVDLSTGVVEPTIILERLGDAEQPLLELFSPIFYMLEYTDLKDLNRFFTHAAYEEQAMYATFFGERVPEAVTRSSVVLVEQTILEVERGNDAYGGMGPKANYVARRGQILDVGPILISEMIGRYCSRSGEG